MGEPILKPLEMFNKKAELIKVDDVTIRYQLQKDSSFVVFENMSLSIEEGSFVSIVGPSGCGKSTLLKIMAGLQKQTCGSVQFKKSEVTGPPQDMVYVFQQYGKSIFPWRTVWQNVIYGIENNRRLTREEINARGKKYLELVGLAGKEKLFPNQMSGGMQQRLAIARALVCEPKVLMMDEPFSAVDALTRMKLQQLVLDIWTETGVTIIFVTHDVEEAVFMSSRVVSLSKSPAKIDKDVRIDLPFPREHLRTKENSLFMKYRHDLLESIFAAESM